MKIFLDTSSLIKLYHVEDGTEYLDKLIESNTITEIFLSDLAKVEFNSAIWKKVRTNDLTGVEAAGIIDSFSYDYENFTFVDLDVEMIHFASVFICKYGLKGLRTLDSLQLVSIIKVKSELSLAITADELLKNIIELEGIKTQ